MQEFTMTVVSLAFCDVAWYRDGCSADLVGEAEFFSRGELFRRGIYLHDQIQSFLLTMSSAWVVANHRTRCLSPGKFRCTTSVPRAPAKAWNTRPTGFSALPPVGPATPVMPMPNVAPQRSRIPSASAIATSRLTAPCFSINSVGTPANLVFSSFE